MFRLSRLSKLSFLLHAHYAAISLLANFILLDHHALRNAHKTISIDELAALGYRLLGAIASYLSMNYPSLFGLISQVTIWLIPTLWLAYMVLILSDIRVGLFLSLQALKHHAPASALVAIGALTCVLLAEVHRLFG